MKNPFIYSNDNKRYHTFNYYLKNKYKEKVCIMELWKYALNNELSKPTRRESNEITLILQSIGGWERGKIERHNEFGNQMFWYKKPNWVELGENQTLDDVL